MFQDEDIKLDVGVINGKINWDGEICKRSEFIPKFEKLIKSKTKVTFKNKDEYPYTYLINKMWYDGMKVTIYLSRED